MPRIAHGPVSADTVAESSNTTAGQQDHHAVQAEPSADRIGHPAEEFPQVELIGEEDILMPEISFELFLERLDEVLRAEADANAVRS